MAVLCTGLGRNVIAFSTHETNDQQTALLLLLQEKISIIGGIP